MKAFLKGKIVELNAKKAKALEAADKSQDVTELKAINSRMEELNEEIKSFEEQLAVLEAQEAQAAITKGFSPISQVYGLSQTAKNKEDTTDKDVEYRKAFMDYVLKGTTIPSALQKEAGTITTEDIGAVIPQNIVEDIVKKLKSNGHIFSRLRHTSIKGGVSYPIENITPKATWVAEGAVAPKDKDKPARIDFKYHKLQCRVAVSLEASVTSLPVFERTISEDVYTAMIVAVEKAAISGTGTGEPSGFTKKTDATSIEMTADMLNEYETYAVIRSKLKSGYRAGAVWLLNQSDWDTYIVGMTDTSGQPIARVTVGLDGVPQERLLGIPALLVEDDYIKPFNEAITGDIFGGLVNLGYYAFNSNMQMTVRRYFDEESDEYVTKSTLIGDGGLLLSEAAVLLKKA